MAKTSAVNRNQKRERMASRDKSKRSELKAQVMDRSAPVEERFEASMKLAQLPRNGAAVRVRLRCALTQLAGVRAEPAEYLDAYAVILVDQTKQEVPGADVVVAQLKSFPQRQLQAFLGRRGERDMPVRRLMAHPDEQLDFSPDPLKREAGRR